MRTFGACVVVIVAGVLALSWATAGFRAFTAESARRVAIASDPVRLPDFRFELQNGDRGSLRDLQGQLVVATFMYTRCSTMCPVIGARMAALKSGLPKELRRETHFLSISFDPRRDTPDNLREYARRHDARIGDWWVVRPVEGLERMLDIFGVTVIPDGRGGYLHNGAFYVIDRAGRLVAIRDYRNPAGVRKRLRREL